MTRLCKLYSFTIAPRPPFNFLATVVKPSHFPSSDHFQVGDSYWQTVRFNRRLLGLRLDHHGDGETPGLDVYVYGAAPLPAAERDALRKEIMFRFDLDAELEPFYSSVSNDPVLGPVIARWRGMRVSAAQSLYEFLMIAIVLQNATVRRSVQMLENLFRRYGGRVTFDGRTLSHFWLPPALAKAPEDKLRALKVGYRATSFRRVSQLFASGGENEMELRHLEKKELKEKLLSIYGVGPASVGYLLFEVFHHYDAFDYVSPWEQKIYSRLLFAKEVVAAESIIAEVDRRWGRWKMLAAHYLFEDLFWRRQHEKVGWLEELIRL